MNRAGIEAVLAASRPELAHPLERPAVTQGPPWGDECNADCQSCGLPLTEREHDPDYSYEGEGGGGSHYSGGEGRCTNCRKPDDDEPDNGAATLTGQRGGRLDDAAGPASSEVRR